MQPRSEEAFSALMQRSDALYKEKSVYSKS